MSFHWKTSDGEERFARAWPGDHGRGVLACVHGLSGCGEQFQPLAEHLGPFSVYALELRGQGLDPVESRRAVILDVEAQHRDIADFLAAIRHRHPGVPLYLVGESMGSLLSASFVAARPDADVEGLVLSVPVVGLKHPVPGWKRRLLKLAGRLLPRCRFSPSLFVRGSSVILPLTRDRAYQDSLRGKAHFITSFSLRVLSELGELIDRSHSIAARIQKPTLVLAAGMDCYVSVSQIEEWFESLGTTDKTLRIYSDAYHLLWHDDDSRRVLSDVGMWLKSRNPVK